MTIASAILIQGYRENNLVPVGKSPTDDEMAEGLVLLNNYIAGIFGYEMGENLGDWMIPVPQRTAPVAGNWPQGPQLLDQPAVAAYPYPPANQRLVWGLKTLTVYFPESPRDGARMALVDGSGTGDGGAAGQTLTINGNGRLIEAAAALTFTSPLASPRAWMYRGDLANWIVVQALALADEMPFPAEFDDFFICALSKRLAPRYNKVSSVETLKTAQDTLKRLKARYRQSAVTTYGSGQIPGTDQSYQPGQWWY